MRRSIDMNGYLPRDRRRLQQYHVDKSLANLFATCVKLKLFKDTSIVPEALIHLAHGLFKLVSRRHTHLWDKVDQHVGAGAVEGSEPDATKERTDTL